MGDEFYLFQLESKSITLDLLTNFLKRKGADPRFLTFISVPKNPQGPGIILYTPLEIERERSFWGMRSESSSDKTVDFAKNLQLLKDVYTEYVRQGAGNGFVDQEETPLIPLSGEWLAKLFLREPDQLAQRPPASDQAIREWLVIGSDLSIERARTVFEDLQRSSTQVRWSVTDHEGQTIYFFHVLDDKERRSNFMSWHKGDYFKDCQTLIAQSYGSFRLFVDYQDTIPVDRLYPCSQLLYYAPALFTEREVVVVEPSRNSDPVPLAAVFRDTDDPNQQTLWYLVGLTFRSEVPAVINWPHVSVLDLEESSERVVMLKDALNDSKRNGYRLTLRKGLYKSYDESLELELNKINRAIYQLKYKKMYITNIRPKRPRLLRYPAKRIDLLAARLRAISREALRNKEIKYGFQATENDPDGTHFLLIPPDITLDEQDKPFLRTREGEPQTEFWIDPLWSTHYGFNINQCPLFVPKHHVLHPSIHSWKIENIEAYLRDVVTIWYQQAHGVAPNIPAKPIYLIDFNTDNEYDLDVHILDQNQFEPVADAFQKINDNLILFDWRGDNIASQIELAHIPDLIKTTSGALQKEAIATWLQQRADAHVEAYVVKRDETASQIATHTHDLEIGLTEEINKIMDDANQLTQQASRLNQQLSSLRALYSSMVEKTETAIRLAHELHDEAENRLDDKIKNLTERVENAIKRSEEARESVQNQITKEVEQFHDTRVQLEDQLRRLRRENWR